jgi:hypothetical protein
MSRLPDNLEPKPDTVAPHPPRFRWLKRIRLVLAILIGTVAGLWGWKLHRANADIAAQIQAIRDRHEPVNVEDLARPPVSDSQNAALILRQAAKSLEASTAWQEEMYELGQDFTPEAFRVRKMRVVGSNPTALALVGKAQMLPDADWHIPVGIPMSRTLLPDGTLQVLSLVRRRVGGGLRCIHAPPMMIIHRRRRERASRSLAASSLPSILE